MMKLFARTLLLCGLAWLPFATAATDSPYEGKEYADAGEAVRFLQHEWARVNYRSPEAERQDALEALARHARAIGDRFDDRADVLVWEAITLSTYAGSLQGLSQLQAIGLVGEARDRLLEAEAIDPEALNGSVYTSLGSLYYQVPGWPLGFGDDAKAREYLHKALAINPDGIDPNYFYGDFLLDQGEYKAAERALDKALAAPQRPQRPVADAGRREEVRAALARVRRR